MINGTKEVTLVLLLGLLLLTPISFVYAAESLGEMKVENTVEVTLSDGSVVELKDGETYPIFEGMTINTLEDGKATLNVKGGRYVIEPQSVFEVSRIDIGNTGLMVDTGNQGEACYCFEPGEAFFVGTPQANSIPHEGTTKTKGYKLFVQARTDFTDGIASAYQIENQADFDANNQVSVLEPGDAISNPPTPNPYDAFESKSGCCRPSPPLFWIPVGVGAAAVTGAIIGAFSSDSTSSNVTP